MHGDYAYTTNAAQGQETALGWGPGAATSRKAETDPAANEPQARWHSTWRRIEGAKSKAGPLSAVSSGLRSDVPPGAGPYACYRPVTAVTAMPPPAVGASWTVSRSTSDLL